MIKKYNNYIKENYKISKYDTNIDEFDVSKDIEEFRSKVENSEEEVVIDKTFNINGWSKPLYVTLRGNVKGGGNPFFISSSWQGHAIGYPTIEQALDYFTNIIEGYKKNHVSK